MIRGQALPEKLGGAPKRARHETAGDGCFLTREMPIAETTGSGRDVHSVGTNIVRPAGEGGENKGTRRVPDRGLVMLDGAREDGEEGEARASEGLLLGIPNPPKGLSRVDEEGHGPEGQCHACDSCAQWRITWGPNRGAKLNSASPARSASKQYKKRGPEGCPVKGNPGLRMGNGE